MSIMPQFNSKIIHEFVAHKFFLAPVEFCHSKILTVLLE